MKVLSALQSAGIGNVAGLEQNIRAIAPSQVGTQGGWGDIVSKESRYASNVPAAANNPNQQLSQLTDLVKLQMQMGHYQLKVELVSKVSESAVASMRKLQQNQ